MFYLISVREWPEKKMLIAVIVRITGLVTTDVYQRGQAYADAHPVCSNHSLCDAWQCQLGVSQYNLFLETKSSACIIQAVQRVTLKMATRGLEEKTHILSLLYYLIYFGCDGLENALNLFM